MLRGAVLHHGCLCLDRCYLKVLIVVAGYKAWEQQLVLEKQGFGSS